jgi:hypothetical protein
MDVDRQIMRSESIDEQRNCHAVACARILAAASWCCEGESQRTGLALANATVGLKKAQKSK